MNATQQRAHKGRGMEGWIARWYTRTRSRDMEDFRRQAKAAAERLRSGSRALEVAPGPGFFAIELARLGDFKITGLDISRTFIDIAAGNARKAGVGVDFRLGNASAMPFADGSFDFVYCSAAFKNFSEPMKALDEMYRVLHPGGEALVVDLRKDASLDEISFYMRKSGRSRIDAWATMWVFRHMLIKRAYRKEDFIHMAEASRFGGCQISLSPIGFEVLFSKPARAASAVC
jgi:ubiquinone/menaquinone biosynthesis C-methylase UbiE